MCRWRHLYTIDTAGVWLKLGEKSPISLPYLHGSGAMDARLEALEEAVRRMQEELTERISEEKVEMIVNYRLNQWEQVKNIIQDLTDQQKRTLEMMTKTSNSEAQYNTISSYARKESEKAHPPIYNTTGDVSFREYIHGAYVWADVIHPMAATWMQAAEAERGIFDEEIFIMNQEGNVEDIRGMSKLLYQMLT